MQTKLLGNADDHLAPSAKQLHRIVSFYRSVRTTRCSARKTAAELLGDIRAARWKTEVETVRKAYEWNGPAAARAKGKLPAIAWSGVFEQRNNASLLTHSGLLCLDLDGLGERLPDARRLLIQDRHVLAVFVSPSGAGLKVIVPVEACDADQHRACFLTAENHFKGLGLEVDQSCKDVARLCFVSFDPDLWLAPGSGLPFSLFTEPIPEPAPIPTLQGDVGGDQLLMVRARTEAQSYFEKVREEAPILVNLYERILADRFDLGLHNRNQWLSEAVPFLFVAFGPSVAQALALLHLRAHRAIYQGNEGEHWTSFRSLWDGCKKNYPAELSGAERTIYEALGGYDKDAFRICRDLARHGEGFEFFLACDHLALRLASPGDVNGWRMLQAFDRLGIIRVVEKGHVRAKGRRTQATRYRWALSPPAQPAP